VHLLRIFCETLRLRELFKIQSADLCASGAGGASRPSEARTDSERVTKGQSVQGRQRPRTGVTYVDLDGEEWEQPADLVLVCAYSLFNVCGCCCCRGIGKTLRSGRRDDGVVGRNYAYQTGSGSTAFFEDRQNSTRFAAAGSARGPAADDYNSG